MKLGKRCWKCGDNDLTVSKRQGSLMVLCAACHVDERTSNVKAQHVEVRDHNDRYARMAEKYGV